MTLERSFTGQSRTPDLDEYILESKAAIKL